MLGDISNQRQASLSSPRALSKQTLERTASKDLASSSSSSPSRLNGSSSPFFSNSRLDAFHASSSPGPTSSKLLSTPTKRSNLLASLPPSSPSFGLGQEDEELDLSSPRQQQQQSSNGLPAEEESSSVALRLETNTVLYFGRKAKKAIPRVQRSPGFNPSERSIPILLPKSAKNASRIHCSARIVKYKQTVSKSGGKGKGKVTIEVRVTGQNGMRIDGKLWKAGSLARLTVENGRELEFSFWGWDANVTVVAPSTSSSSSSSKRKAINEAEQSSALKRPRTTMEDDSESQEEEDGRAGSSKRSRQTSPTTSLSSLSSSSPPALSPAAIRARSLASSPELDLPGLLASTIVFHPRSTVGVDELVRALLKESGQQLWQVLSEDREEVEKLKQTNRGEEDAVKVWIPVCQEVLKSERMFGVIDNTGLKDAAGRPLPPYYYYIPDLDQSRSRVEALEPFVKRVRGARTSKPIRYFWAKPK
ncbi:hypothetical protein JCM5350_006734 [Sporobolomyces pararoseus]